MTLAFPKGVKPGRIEKPDAKVRDRKYLDSYEGEACWACGSTGTTVGAHIRDGECAGMGTKPSDDLTIPLCAKCHADQEANRGPWWWLENVLKPIARRRYQVWSR